MTFPVFFKLLKKLLDSKPIRGNYSYFSIVVDSISTQIHTSDIEFLPINQDIFCVHIGIFLTMCDVRNRRREVVFLMLSYQYANLYSLAYFFFKLIHKCFVFKILCLNKNASCGRCYKSRKVVTTIKRTYPEIVW